MMHKIINNYGQYTEDGDINNHIAHSYKLCEECCHNFQLTDSLLPYCKPCISSFREYICEQEYIKFQPRVEFWQKAIVYPAIASVIGFLGLLMYLKIDNTFIQIGASFLFLTVIGGIGYYPVKMFRAFKDRNEQRIYEKAVRAFPFNQAELDELEEMK